MMEPERLLIDGVEAEKTTVIWTRPVQYYAADLSHMVVILKDSEVEKIAQRVVALLRGDA